MSESAKRRERFWYGYLAALGVVNLLLLGSWLGEPRAQLSPPIPRQNLDFEKVHRQAVLEETSRWCLTDLAAGASPDISSWCIALGQHAAGR